MKSKSSENDESKGGDLDDKIITTGNEVDGNLKVRI